MRKLATIRRIAEIKPIENADAIEAARVDGWWVVVKRGEYSVGDLACYIEIDSWVPYTLAPFLSKGNEPREYEGIKGERLRTIRLRGHISQGLLLPLSGFNEGDDVTEYLGIVKYEPPVPACLGGAARGNFPGFMKKTDQERIQNCFNDVSPLFNEPWAVEEKLDGSSMSVGYRMVDGEEDIHVCSRNLSLTLDNHGNSFVKIAHKTGLIIALTRLGRNLAVSGELCGEGIQGNKYNLKGQQFFVFDILDVDTQKYVSVHERNAIITQLVELGFDAKQVPSIGIQTLSGQTVNSLLELAEAKTAFGNGAEREGLVFKNVNNPDISFKAISNKFLMKTGE